MSEHSENKNGQGGESHSPEFDIEKFEYLKRYIYSALHISWEGLHVMMLCHTGGIDLPTWIVRELNADIPADALKDDVDKAAASARRALENNYDPTAVKFDVADAPDSEIQFLFEVISGFAGHSITSFGQFRSWLLERGDHPGLQDFPGYLDDGYSRQTCEHA